MGPVTRRGLSIADCVFTARYLLAARRWATLVEKRQLFGPNRHRQPIDFGHDVRGQRPIRVLDGLRLYLNSMSVNRLWQFLVENFGFSAFEIPKLVFAVTGVRDYCKRYHSNL